MRRSAPVVFFSGPHGLALRFVLKRELLWDPCLDIVGHRLPNCFVQRGSGQNAAEIAAVRALTTDLGPTDGVLIYPEGTRFTEEKRARVLAKLAAKIDPLLAEARALTHVLPPHLGGPLGLLEGDHGADVVVIAHTGLEGAASFRNLLNGTLVGATVRLRFWRVPCAEIPLAYDARARWLYAQWRRIDDWIGEQGTIAHLECASRRRGREGGRTLTRLSGDEQRDRGCNRRMLPELGWFRVVRGGIDGGVTARASRIEPRFAATERLLTRPSCRL